MRRLLQSFKIGLTTLSLCLFCSSRTSTSQSSPSTMLSTRPVSLPICPTSRLQLYELAPTRYTHFVSGADRWQKVTGYLPKDDGLASALKGADIVVIPAGIPRTCASAIISASDRVCTDGPQASLV